MAEKAEKKPESKAPAAAAPAPVAPAAEKKGGGLMTSTPVLLAVVMVLEGAILFAGFKMLGGSPKPAQGGELTETVEGGHGAAAGHGEKDAKGGGKADRKKNVELNVLDFKAPNKRTGRTFLYDVSIYVVTKGEHEEKVKQTIKDREAMIKDRIRTIIAQSDPEKLGGGGEPGLETLRRQVKYQLDEIIGEGMIDEVLVPRCIPYRADF